MRILGAPYRNLLPTMYLCIADIANSDLFVCVCRAWICGDITRFYEEQCQSSNMSVWPACPKKVSTQFAQ